MKNKKITAAVLAGALSLSLTTAVLADADPIDSGVPLLVSTQAYPANVLINNEQIPANIYENNGQLMVPVRLIGEKLGFKIEWIEEENAVFLDNGKKNTTVYIGLDSYYTASSTAIGMSAPSSLGAAPELLNDTTYVPLKLFELLDDISVNIDNNTITITRNDNSDKEDNSLVQIPNPIIEYNTVDEAKASLGIDASIPTALPAGYELSKITTISNTALDLTYVNGESELSYRTAKSLEDISGDYNTYEFTKTAEINGYEVSYSGNGQKVHNAKWNNGEFSFSIYADNGITFDELKSMIESII